MSTLKHKPDQDSYRALTEYIQKDQNRFYLLAFSYVKNRETALDVVQNAIYSSLKAIHTLKEPAYVKTWFYRILVNACLDELRKNQRAIPTDPQALPEAAAPESPVSREELLDLRQALDSLSDNARTIIILRYFEDMKIEDVAAVLGENVNTVKTKLYRALEKLRVHMQGEVFKDA